MWCQGSEGEMTLWVSEMTKATLIFLLSPKRAVFRNIPFDRAVTAVWHDVDQPVVKRRPPMFSSPRPSHRGRQGVLQRRPAGISPPEGQHPVDLIRAVTVMYYMYIQYPIFEGIFWRERDRFTSLWIAPQLNRYGSTLFTVESRGVLGQHYGLFTRTTRLGGYCRILVRDVSP